MGGIFSLSIIPAAIAMFTTLALTPVVIKIANRLHIVDDPKVNIHPKAIHTYPIPRAGGLAIFLGIFITCLIVLPLDKHLAGILIGAIILTALGLVDDIYNLNPYPRFLIQFIAASIPIISGIGIAFVSNPFGGIIDLTQPRINFFLLGESRSLWIVADLFALLWIVFMMNMLNIGAKGVDGQLPGVVAIASATIAALSFRYSADITQWSVIVLASIVAGSYLGFLPWNFYPQKIMPGFSGSILAGYMLAVLSILTTTKVGTLIVVLGIPFVDTGYAIIRRVLSGKSPFWGDRGHLHHHLINLGLTKKQVSFLYWAATALLGILALNLNSTYKLYALFGVIITIAGFLIWINYKPKKQS